MPRKLTLKKFLEGIAATYVLPAGRTYLVIGPNVWGKSRDLYAAMKHAQKQTGRKIDRVIVYDVPEDAVIDEMGYIVYTRVKKGAPAYTEIGRFPANAEEDK